MTGFTTKAENETNDKKEIKHQTVEPSNKDENNNTTVKLVETSTENKMEQREVEDLVTETREVLKETAKNEEKSENKESLVVKNPYKKI